MFARCSSLPLNLASKPPLPTQRNVKTESAWPGWTSEENHNGGHYATPRCHIFIVGELLKLRDVLTYSLLAARSVSTVCSCLGGCDSSLPPARSVSTDLIRRRRQLALCSRLWFVVVTAIERGVALCFVYSSVPHTAARVFFSGMTQHFYRIFVCVRKSNGGK